MDVSERLTALIKTLADSLVGLADKPEESADGTARALWCAAAGKPCSVVRAASDPLPDLDETGLARLERLVERRLAGIPLAHLTGWQHFMGLELLASPDALVPRRETEILGQAALAKLRALVQERGRATVLDVCTGSANLAVALAHREPGATVFASDLSPQAASLARRNVALHGLQARVEVREGDLFAPFAEDAFRGHVDLVVCNPPYISSAKVSALPSEIADFEPRLAFDGGPLGVNLLSRILKEAPGFLRPRSWLCVEIGLGQGDYFHRYLSRMPEFSCVEAFPDPTGATRALAAHTR